MLKCQHPSEAIRYALVNCQLQKVQLLMECFMYNTKFLSIVNQEILKGHLVPSGVIALYPDSENKNRPVTNSFERGVTENSRSAPVCAGSRRSAPVRAGLRRSKKNYFLPIIKFIMCFRYFVMPFIDGYHKKLFRL
jgi:hypothetical protein